MEHAYQNRLCFSVDELCFNAANGSNNGKISKKKYQNDGTIVFTSKNLETERKRREKLSTRLLTLRSLVPIITNMNKATIIDDAITYITKLKDEVDNLSQQLSQMEATSEEIVEPKIDELNAAAEEMRKWGIQEEIEVTKFDGNKLWVKIVIGIERERFTKLVDAMSYSGIEMIDPNVTTINGAYLITAYIQGNIEGEPLEVHQTKQFLADIIKVI